MEKIGRQSKILSLIVDTIRRNLDVRHADRKTEKEAGLDFCVT